MRNGIKGLTLAGGLAALLVVCTSPVFALHDCPNDQDLWPFQWTGTAPGGTPGAYADCASAPALNYGSAACEDFNGADLVTFSDGTPGPEDIDHGVAGTFETDPNVSCMHLGSGDGFIKPADDPANYDTGDLYMFGFADLTGVDIDEAFEWGLMANQSPAPTINVHEGDDFYLALSNVGMVMRPDLFDPHTVHWHGFPHASAIFDGVPDNSVSINMGSTWTYYYKVPGPGTYLYHCHVEATEHMQMGMMGNLYVTPLQDDIAGTIPAHVTPNGTSKTYTKFAYNDGDGSTGYDVDFPLQFLAYDPVFHEASLLVQPLPFAEMDDTLYVINGRGYPDTVVEAPLGPFALNGETQGSPMSAKVTANQGDTILLRFSNVMVEDIQTVTVLGIPMKVVGKDAKLLRGPDGKDLSYTTNSITMGGGESYDVLLYTDNIAAGTYYLYARSLDQLNNNEEDQGGAMTEIEIL